VVFAAVGEAAGDGLVPGGEDGHGETGGVQNRAGGAGAVGEAGQQQRRVQGNGGEGVDGHPVRAAVAVHGGDDRDAGGPAAHGVAHCGLVGDGHGGELGHRCLLVIGGQAR
jgi:hypothetical protein